MRNRPILLVVLGAALVLSACAASSGSSSASSSVAPSVAVATPIPIGTDLNGECSTGAPCHCSHEKPCQFTDGTYTTFGRWAFLPGLTMAIPAGWYSTEQDAGEFNLLHTSYGQGGLFFWRDMIPVDPEGDRVDIPSTPQALTEWFTNNPNLAVSEPESVTIGRGIEATTFTFTTASGAQNTDPTCPDYPPDAAVCFAVFTDPAHWGDGSWYTASAHATRLYLASIGPDASPHLLLVAVLGTVEAPSTETDPFVELARIEAAVQPILDSLDVSNVTFN